MLLLSSSFINISEVKMELIKHTYEQHGAVFVYTKGNYVNKLSSQRAIKVRHIYWNPRWPRQIKNHIEVNDGNIVEDNYGTLITKIKYLR